jgi:hypothetical protein
MLERRVRQEVSCTASPCYRPYSSERPLVRTRKAAQSSDLSKEIPSKTARPKVKRISFLTIIAALSVVGFPAVRTIRGLMMLGYEDSAIGRVRVISAAETEFAKVHLELGYTCTLSQLPHTEEITRILRQDQIDNGYAFKIGGCQAAAAKKPISTYNITARPLNMGQPAFCSDQSGILMSDEGGSVEKCLAKRSPFP